ncbi:MAG: glycosyltransferase family 4 protein [Sedimentisphaerales bacterium]|nr:glycosyltransferase family 4 protein [Sedimentisphaerales bacterium]
MVKKPSICFVSLDNFAALADDSKFGFIGGAEMQQVIIGRNLVKRGYRVSFITLDHGQDDKLEIDGMRIIKAYNKNTGIPVLRFAHSRLISLWHAMKKADADIYYQRTRDSITGIVAVFCRCYDRAFVFALASNSQCMTDPPYRLPMHIRILYRYGLQRANLVIAQTVMQQKLLRENFDINSKVIPNCTPDSVCGSNGAYNAIPNKENRLLWVGNFCRIKRLELFLDIAEQNKNLQFDIVGDSERQSDYIKSLKSRAESIPNVNLHGRVPHARIQIFYQQATALICTSLSEGFPNTFLEAWSCGLPIVSTFDPDGIIADKGLGIIAKEVRGLTDGIHSLCDSPDRWKEMSRKVRNYYLENHTVDVVMAKFEKAFTEISKNSVLQN